MPATLFLACAFFLCCLPSMRAEAADPPLWSARLEADLAQVDKQHPVGLGVYVRDLDTGATASYRAGERWYLASMVKVPVAIAVLRGVEQGTYTLDTPLTLRASDYVDGGGMTNSHAIGTALSIRYLLEQMIIHSDNTASDMLIGLVGIAQVNALVESLVPEGFERITSLADVRRLVYGRMLPAASRLEGADLLLLKRQKTDAERLQVLAQLLETPTARLRLPALGDAYDAYYASGVNSGRLDAYGELLALLANGMALGPKYTAYLLKLMERVVTGPDRIKAGLPADARFAHKTGTQRGRICDSGIVSVAGPAHEKRVVVVACTRGNVSLKRSELALRQVGAAICRSGLLTRSTPIPQGTPHAPHCDAAANPGPVPAPGER